MKLFFFISLLFLSPILSYSQCGSCNKCDDLLLKTKSNYSQSTFNKTKSQENQKLDENSQENDEFEEFTEQSENNSVDKNIADEKYTITRYMTLFIVFLGVILSGIFVRFKPTRHLRVVFIIGFLIYLGFYLGGCPCPISSFQNVILMAFGSNFGFESMIYFIGLIPLTYIFGKVWCGWICHLGTLQELLQIHRKFKFFKSAKSQKVMKLIRLLLLITLIIQLAITHTNWFCKIDPFLVAFNFISAYQVGWYLLGLLIITSIFIHRPFCQAVCPIGLILGLVSKIPGARKINYNENCTSCSICSDNCKIGAITKDNGNNKINSIECNFCGECLDSCTKYAIFIQHK